MSDDQAQPAPPGIKYMTVEELAETMMTWTAFSNIMDAVKTDLDKGATSTEAKAKIYERSTMAFAGFVSSLVVYTQSNPNWTPFVASQVMFGALLEFMFSALIAEKQTFGLQEDTEALCKEYMETCERTCMFILSELTDKMNDKTFTQRVISRMNASANTQGPSTKQ